MLYTTAPKHLDFPATKRTKNPVAYARNYYTMKHEIPYWGITTPEHLEEQQAMTYAKHAGSHFTTEEGLQKSIQQKHMILKGEQQ